MQSKRQELNSVTKVGLLFTFGTSIQLAVCHCGTQAWMYGHVHGPDRKRDVAARWCCVQVMNLIKTSRAALLLYRGRPSSPTSVLAKPGSGGSDTGGSAAGPA